VHLLLYAFLEVDGPTDMTRDVVVVGLGNGYRKDDGVGVVAADAIKEAASPQVRVVTNVSDPARLLDAWQDTGLAVVIDAAEGNPSTLGNVRRWTTSDLTHISEGLSSHSIDIGATYALAQALGRAPAVMVVFTVDVLDTGNGVGLNGQVADAVPEVVRLVLAEINQGPTTRSPHPASR
jgi:hydrogenase maturation protease